MMTALSTKCLPIWYYIIAVLVVISISTGKTDDNDKTGKFIAGKYFGEDNSRQAPVNPVFPSDSASIEFTTPGTWPTGLVRTSSAFLIADTDSNQIYSFSSQGILFDSISSPDDFPGGLEWVGLNILLVCEETAKLYKIDPNTGDTTASFNLPDSQAVDPNSWGLAWDNTRLWHSQYGDSARIYQIDPLTGDVLNSFPAPSGVTTLLGIAWDGEYLCGVDINSMTLYRMDPDDSGAVFDSYPWEVPYPLGLDYIGTDFWNVSGSTDWGGTQSVYRVNLTTGIKEIFPLSREIGNISSYPNPFNNTTKINYSLSKSSYINLDIYNVLGQTVKKLFNGYQQAGEYSIYWRADDFNSGIYYVRLMAEKKSMTRKLILIK